MYCLMSALWILRKILFYKQLFPIKSCLIAIGALKISFFFLFFFEHLF